MPTWNPRRHAALAAPALAVALLAGAAPAVATVPVEPPPATSAAVAAVVRAEDAPQPFVIEDPRIVESSGLQASHRHPGVYWTHNDSDYPPEIYAVDGDTGQTVATVRMEGVEARDMEAIQLGPEGDLYVGDIGDNLDGGWPHVWIYRLPEPERLADTSVAPAVYTVQYEDGPRDAEALLVHPETGRVYLVSKKRSEPGTLYAGPEELSEEGVNTFRPVADIDLWVTDGAFSPDGTRMVLRGYFAAQMFRWQEGEPPERIERHLRVPFQRQGESVTFTPDGRTLMYGSEGERSEVRPVALSGDLLPESVQEEDARAEEEAAGQAGGGEDLAQDDDRESDESGGVSWPVMSVLLVLAALLVLRRYLAYRRRKLRERRDGDG